MRGALQVMAVEENDMSPTKKNLLAHAKKQAKTLRKTSPEKPYHQCLDEIAQNLGFRDYHYLVRQEKYNDTQLNPNTCLVDKYADLIKRVLADCIDKKPNDELVTQLWSLLFSPVNSDSNLEHIERLTKWDIDKERLKQYGYSCHEGDSDQYEDLGYILVAMGHYYRSLMDNCSYQIGEHIVFKSYFGYWLRNDFINNPTVLEELKQLYPAYGDPELSGATSWAPKWWLQKAGRI